MQTAKTQSERKPALTRADSSAAVSGFPGQPVPVPFKAPDLAELRRSCTRLSLKDLCLPRGILPADLQALDGCVPTWLMEDKEFLFRAGDELSAFYVVRSGAVTAHILEASGARRVLGFYLPGELVGLDALQCGKHLANCAALGPSAICTLPTYRLGEIFTRVPRLRDQLRQLTTGTACSEHQILLSLHQLNDQQRVAAVLLDLARRYLWAGYSPVRFRVPMTRHQLAAYLNTPAESVTRALIRLRACGVLNTHGREIHILKIRQLAKLSGMPLSFRWYAQAGLTG